MCAFKRLTWKYGVYTAAMHAGIKRLLINAHRSVPRVETGALCIKFILISAISFSYHACHVRKWLPAIVRFKSIISDAVVEIKKRNFTCHISLVALNLSTILAKIWFNTPHYSVKWLDCIMLYRGIQMLTQVHRVAAIAV